MTGTTLAKIHWRALDREGDDKCRLARLDTGFMLVGHARFRDGAGWAALDYVVRMDADWRTSSADVTGTYAGEDVAFRLTRERDVWQMNGETRRDLDGCEDIDFAFTPATNTMPLNRLPDVGRIEVTSAWFRLPGPQVSPLNQSYTRERGHLVRYTAEETAFETQLQVDEHGFITLYPGLWDREDG